MRGLFGRRRAPGPRPIRPAAVAAALALALWPASTLADSTCTGPPASVAESPGGPVFLVLMGIGAAVALVVVRRRGGGLVASSVSTVLTVVVAGIVFGAVTAGAASSACTPAGSGGGGGGGVLAIATATGAVPGTGADLPWVDALLLVGGGAILALIGVPRRRSPGDPPAH